jgi:hypothetical protein
MLLNKRLPTEKIRKRLEKKRPKEQSSIAEFCDNYVPPTTDEENQLRLYENVKLKIMEVAHAKDESGQKELVEQLRAMDDHKRVRVHSTIENFLEKLEYYHTSDELESRGVTHEMCYTNVCENAMNVIRHIWDIHNGFRSIEAAKHYVNYFWWKWRTHPSASTDAADEPNPAHPSNGTPQPFR